MRDSNMGGWGWSGVRRSLADASGWRVRAGGLFVAIAVLVLIGSAGGQEFGLPQTDGLGPASDVELARDVELAAFLQQQPGLSAPVAPAQPMARSYRSSRQSGLA